VSQGPQNGFALAEIAFLKAFAQDSPDDFQLLLNKKDKFRIVGGGITSPENLVVNGEAFFRNFLLGTKWIESVGFPWTRMVWLPDDFGQDSQLPVMLAAMGTRGVGFSRVPGGCWQGIDGFNPTSNSTYNSTHVLLTSASSGGLEFNWEGADGSRVFAYYMPTHYCAASTLRNLDAPDFRDRADVSQCRVRPLPADPLARIENYISIKSSLVSTDYMYVPAGCDFEIPLGNLLVDVVEQWNRDKFNETGTFLVASSFDYYVDLVTNSLSTPLKTRTFSNPSADSSFVSNPYWMGYYASRPAIKQLHYGTSRLLLAAEVFSCLSEDLFAVLKNPSWKTLKIGQATIDGLWEAFVPSTHHDFVTGTADDYVTEGEQLPLIKDAFNNATTLVNDIIDRVIYVNRNTDGGGSHVSSYAWNALGFPRNGVATVGGRPDLLINMPGLKRVQVTTDEAGKKGLLAFVDAPSLGYRIHNEADLKRDLPRGSIQLTEIGGNYTMENDYLRAIISKDANWTITSFIDKATGKEILKAGNFFTFRYDRGNLYRFGYEDDCGFLPINIALTPLDATLVEKDGPLRTYLSAHMEVKNPHQPLKSLLSVSYELRFNEPFIRIHVSGKADPFTTIFTNFEFVNTIKEYHHGTPYHWDTKKPLAYGTVPDFRVVMEATHNFIIPQSNNDTQIAAIYHGSIPAWGVLLPPESTPATAEALPNTLIGALLRNTPEASCNSKGAAGSDDDVHEFDYALRVPSGLTGPETGQVFKEALAFVSPMIVVTSPTLGIVKEYSMATVNSPDSAIITVYKKGSRNITNTILRIYNPSNAPASVQLALINTNHNFSNVSVTTSLEDITMDNTTSYLHYQYLGDLCEITIGTTALALLSLSLPGSAAPAPPSPTPTPTQPPPSPTPTPTPAPNIPYSTAIIIAVVVLLFGMLLVGGVLWYRRRSYTSISDTSPPRYDDYLDSESELTTDR